MELSIDKLMHTAVSSGPKSTNLVLLRVSRIQQNKKEINIPLP